jgi:tetratricopeptide (TPR) repeat protein
MIRKLIILVFFACNLALHLLLVSCSTDTKNQQAEKSDTLTSFYLNHHDSAKYVGMKTCMLCHQDMHKTFIETGMGKSFEHAHRGKTSANFDHPIIYDKYADFYYKSFWKNDNMFMHEFRLLNKDTIYQRIEKVDYIIGSGQHTNSHMQSINGYFNQMPMTFYTQKKQWDLPPGFENGFNTRFNRKIGLECMSCHNSYPDFVLGSENKYRSVPEGITCERCHGPGSIHVAQRSNGSKIDTSKYIDYSIVNPAKLAIDRQFDICQRCHLQGNAVLKEGKSFLDFKPGMKLSDFLTVFLPKYANADDEFIMASHADRLKQSKCFIQSYEKSMKQNTKELKPYKNAMTCVTCHNPHVSVKSSNNEKFNLACLNCHTNQQKTTTNCTEKSIKQQIVVNTKNSINCVGCHMPRSGSIDIPHVTVHDHYIRKPSSKSEKEKVKQFMGLFAINDKNPDSLTRAKAYINQFEKFEQKTFYLDSAIKYLSVKNISDITKNIDALVQLNFLQQNYSKVLELVSKIGIDKLLKTRLNKQSYTNEHAWTCYRIAESFLNMNSPVQSLQFHKKAVELAPYVPDFRDKLANCYAINGDIKNAEIQFQQTLKEYPKHISALTNYGFLVLTTGNMQKAEQLYNDALRLDPDFEPLLMNVAGLKNFKGDKKGAIEVLHKILKKNPNNQQAKAILERLKV